MALAYRDERIREYLLPTAIVAKSDNVTGENKLLTTFSAQNVIGKKDSCIIAGKGYVIFDFGQEYFGGVRIALGTSSYSSEHCNLRIRFGESLCECCSDIGEKNATNDHSTRDMCVYMSFNSDMEWGSTGYRYVRLDFISDGTLQLDNVFGVYVHGAEPVGRFESDNPLLDRIFSTAARTLFLNAQNYIWDGIKRDQHVWVGDLFPEVLGILYLYGDCAVLRNTLDFVTEIPLPCWYNEIPSYSIWYVLIIKAYYEITGRTNARYTAAVTGILKQLDACVDEEGSVDFDRAGLPLWEKNFFDWPSVGDKNANFACAALLGYAVEETAKCELMSDEAVALANRIAAKLSARGAGSASNKAMAAIGLLAGNSGKEQALAYLNEGGAKGYSAFMSYFISKALADNGCVAEAYKNNLQYYGAMLDMGATTFWEGFDIDWVENSCRIDEFPKEGQKDIHGDFGSDCYVGYRHSLCHGWSCGVIGFIIEYVVGVKIHNGKYVAVRPNPCGLKRFKCTIPTTSGKIEVSYSEKGGVEAILPDGLVLQKEGL